MSQLKETMKQQSNTKDDDNATMEDEQDPSVEESTSEKLLVDTPNCDENSVTVEITMTTLPADEVEVRILEISLPVCIHVLRDLRMYNIRKILQNGIPYT